MDHNPSCFNPDYFEREDEEEWCDDLPVEQVNWFDCVRFCNTLSVAQGLDPVYEIRLGSRSVVQLNLDRSGYRLPTEAEWEYIAKAGTELIYAGSNNIDEVAWYEVITAYEGTSPVGEKRPNAWGIFDCSGNVDEWCNDQRFFSAYERRVGIVRDPYERDCAGYTATRMYRGGCSDSDPDFCRVAYRGWDYTHHSGSHLGLRLLRS